MARRARARIKYLCEAYLFKLICNHVMIAIINKYVNAIALQYNKWIALVVCVCNGRLYICNDMTIYNIFTKKYWRGACPQHGGTRFIFSHTK